MDEKRVVEEDLDTPLAKGQANFVIMNALKCSILGLWRPLEDLLGAFWRPYGYLWGTFWAPFWGAGGLSDTL